MPTQCNTKPLEFESQGAKSYAKRRSPFSRPSVFAGQENMSPADG